MRRTFTFCARWLLALGAAVACHTVSNAGPEDIEHLSLVGRVFVEPVDARRIVVAVTTRMDSASEHLFLYTARERLAAATPRLRNVMASVYYETGAGLRITPVVQGAQILEFVVSAAFDSRRSDGSVLDFRETQGLKHYVANPRLKLVELEALHKTGDCNRSPQACVEVAGQFLPFPG